MATLRNLLVRYSTFLILLFLVIFFSLVSSRFLTASNILNILDQSALLGVVAIGVTYTIISGGIDLSVGSLVAFVGAVSAGVIVRSGVSVPAGILLGLLVGTGMGFMNGLFVVYGRLQPFVATLAMMAIARG
ncbi:MAG: ribose ABC transporter permease, partial [Alkalispirochaeta sp.]